jgi:Bacterial PH domain
VSSAPVPTALARAFRLQRSAYLGVLFLLFCTVPLAVAGSASQLSRPELSPRLLLLLLPVVATVFIARTATFVDGQGIRVRAAFGSRRLSWDEVRGLSIAERAVYAVCVDGSVRLPCVRVADLAAVAAASNGRLPEIAAPTPKFAPSRPTRRRRRA